MNERVLVNAVAERTVELLMPRLLSALTGDGGGSDDHDLVDAATMADLLGVTRGYVYAHADDLGVVRLGEGPRPRLRFDVDAARAALRRSHGEGSQQPDTSTVAPIRGGRRAGDRRRLPNGLPEPGSVLASRGRAA
jgi:hypothetical protein